MQQKKFKAIVVSVGGTPAPVVFALNQARPEYICFFVSQQTRKMIEDEILPGLEFKPRHYDWITTPNADLLSESYSQLTKKLPEILEKWEITPDQICVDYTGGTKTMSAALALATIDKSCCYSYIGGDERSKGGIGVVLNGKERMWFLDNPWDEIAAFERREVAILFNKARYASAADILEKCISRVSKEKKPFFKALREMVLGYDAWDRFQHSKAKTHLYKSLEILMALSSADGEMKRLVDQVERNLSFLWNLLAGEKPSPFYFQDLLANARRRAELEQKFDDAVARLYRAMEVLAQMELKGACKIDTSNVRAESIPAPIRQEFISKYQSKEDKKIRIPLYGSFRLLQELANPLAANFFKAYDKEIRRLLEIRNSSILAHGFEPIKEKTFQGLWDSIMQFSGAKEEDLPRFPLLKI